MYLTYEFDKSKAKGGAWQLKESTLHFLSFVGGWPAVCSFIATKSKKKIIEKRAW
ncbi:MAG: uncharacterized membrane protein YsdA (DUF1294 family) [Flavobacteriales bacterium]|jgi:uncharacterized membrane protein YsdA (DUF1294 family)